MNDLFITIIVAFLPGSLQRIPLYNAHRTVERILEHAESISRLPRKGRTVPEYEREDIREDSIILTGLSI